MSGVTNSGIVGYVSNPVAIFPKNSITVDIFGNVFYRDYIFGAGDDTGVYWNDEIEYTKNTMLFFASSMSKRLANTYSYGNKLRSSQSYDFKIQLPIRAQDNTIDFEFIDTFVAELQAQHVAELQAYLSVTGLSHYELTQEEFDCLNNFMDDPSKLSWQKYNLKALFGSSTRGKRLKSADRIVGALPFVTAGEQDTGISAFIGNAVEVFKKNTITIDMFGSAKYRNYDYGADDHIAVVHTETLNKYATLFLTAVIEKVSHQGQFSYGRNFYAKDADALDVLLPTKGCEPDYGFMELLMSAIQKQVIKDVVEYANKEAKAYKLVIGN